MSLSEFNRFFKKQSLAATYKPTLLKCLLDLGDYNQDGQKEYDALGYFDDPWYLAIFTSWVDDWYYGGNIEYGDDRQIGGYDWNDNGDGICEKSELISSNEGDLNIDSRALIQFLFPRTVLISPLCAI